jgi:hypothetical protein
VRGIPAEERIRFASRVVSNPGPAISFWKALSGWKAARCPLRFPAPEVLHSVEMLPVFAETGEAPSLLRIPYDAWIEDPANPGIDAPGDRGQVHFVLPDPIPGDTENALDLIEAVAEWAEAVTGRRCTEGALDKSLRAYGERDAWFRALAGRCEAEPGFLAPAALRNVLRSGNFLPVDSHTRLLKGILGRDVPAAAATGTRGDPFLSLARRICRVPPRGEA